MSCTRPSSRLAVVIVGLCLAGPLQGCSSSRDGDGSSSWKLWGNDGNAGPSQTASGPAPRPTTGFDTDGPPGQGAGTYRGGRDPVTGRAQNDWPPAAPPTAPSYTQAPTYRSAASVPGPGQAPYRQPYSQPYSQPNPGYPGASAARGGPTSSVEVRPGDTLYRIARDNNVTVPSLMQANGLSSESLKVGQRLTIPGN